MKLNIATEYLDPIDLDSYEHVTIILPNGVSVTVFDDTVYVATQQERFRHKDGQKIWTLNQGVISP